MCVSAYLHNIQNIAEKYVWFDQTSNLSINLTFYY